MFNPDARWDRPLPLDNQASEEPIIVSAIFQKGKILPRWFILDGRIHRIKAITYQWQARRGQEVLHYFSVDDGTNIYQIYLNTRYLSWRLAGVCPD